MQLDLGPLLPVEWLAAALYEWWREMEENRMTTGFRVRVADTTTGPSGVQWLSLNRSQKDEVETFTAETLSGYAPADTSTWSFRFGMNRDLIEMSRAHVVSLATLLWPDREARKRHVTAYLALRR